jgi:hypothetical protein
MRPAAVAATLARGAGIAKIGQKRHSPLSARRSAKNRFFNRGDG